MDDKLYIYNGLDVCCTYEVRNGIWDEIDADGYRWAYNQTIRLFEPLMFMMTRGIKINRAALEETKKDIIADRDAAQEELNRIAGFHLNANSPKQCQNYFYILKGITPYRGKEGNITTDDRALARIARGTATRPGLREAKLVQTIRGCETLLGRYMEIQFDADDRLRGAYNPRGTKFGRLSSGETVFGTGCNLQAMPQEFKKFLVPDDGYFFMEKDKRQAEWVVVAYYSGDARMLHVIENGIDPHAYTGGMMLLETLPYDIRKQVTEKQIEELVKYEAKITGQLTDADEIIQRRLADARLKPWADFMPRVWSVRQGGKKANHGLNYGEQYRMFSLINEIPEAEAKIIIPLYHKVYPGVENGFQHGIKQQLAKDRTLTNCFGRKMRFLDQWGNDLWKQAYASIPQSTVVDSLNMGMCDTYEDDNISLDMDIDTMAQTHDSVLYQIPKKWIGTKRLWETSKKIDHYLSPQMEYGGRKFKIATDSKVGWNWGGYHKDRNPTGLKEMAEANTEKEFHARLAESLK